MSSRSSFSLALIALFITATVLCLGAFYSKLMRYKYTQPDYGYIFQFQITSVCIVHCNAISHSVRKNPLSQWQGFGIEYCITLTLNFTESMIVVTRNSLLISEKAIRLSVDVIAKDEPWEYAVRNGQSLAANSARKILRLFLESSENQTYPVLPSLAGPLHAMGALAVFVVTRQDSRMASMDRELLKAAALAVKDAHTLGRVERELEFALNKLNTFVTAATGSHRHYRSRPSQRPEAESSALPPELTTREQVPISAWNPLWQVPEHNASLVQGSGETFSVIPTGQMSNLDGQNDLACSDWWIEDSSPMIMDELGWNWANFSQLLDGRDNQPQIQL